MLQWQIGDVTVSRVFELEALMSPRFMFQHPEAEVLAIDWMRPHFITEEGLIKLSIHALVVDSMGKRIVVDTCVGNDKPREFEDWSMRQGSFLEDMTAAGFPRESVDVVMCTHLHVDHVGWNTFLVDGQWVPTFPNARYLFAEQEWNHWSKTEQAEFGAVVEDSVQPVIDAGLADLVAMDHRITDEVWLEPTPGHTPGHVSVRISSRGKEAVITGDMTHHPCQLVHPDWASTFDTDTKMSTVTRRDFYARHADKSVLMIGTHFAEPTAGILISEGDSYRLDFEQEH